MFYIEPESYTIGSRLEPRRVNGVVTNVPTVATGQRVPLHAVFRKFLQLPGVFKESVAYMAKAWSETYTDFVDGLLWKEVASEWTEQDINFSYMLYFDDFEAVNPLGSLAGVHKLGSILYACLKCFLTKFNSKLKNLFLALLFYSADRTHFGNEAFFGILIDEINYLRNVGISVDVMDDTSYVPAKLYFEKCMHTANLICCDI